MSDLEVLEVQVPHDAATDGSWVDRKDLFLRGLQLVDSWSEAGGGVDVTLASTHLRCVKV